MCRARNIVSEQSICSGLSLLQQLLPVLIELQLPEKAYLVLHMSNKHVKSFFFCMSNRTYC